MVGFDQNKAWRGIWFSTQTRRLGTLHDRFVSVRDKHAMNPRSNPPDGIELPFSIINFAVGIRLIHNDLMLFAAPERQAEKAFTRGSDANRLDRVNPGDSAQA
jgi:hypothetical protein